MRARFGGPFPFRHAVVTTNESCATFSGVAWTKMESSAWTSQRLDEFARRIDQRFEQVDQRFEQVDQRFAQVDQRFTQVDRRFDRVERDIRDLGGKLEQGFQGINDRLFRVGGGIIVTLIGVIGAILARGT
jgi:septal ring factor EnvC (AmiA/AmiB activator)